MFRHMINSGWSRLRKSEVPLVQTLTRGQKEKFFVELIKPSNYDDDGYVMQWWKSVSISNSLACLYGLAIDAARRDILGNDVELVVNIHDDHNAVIPTRRIIRRIQRGGGRGLICLVGVQTNQYPRAVDIARPFCDADIPVVIGGFHVSGCLAMVPSISGDLQEALDLGITLFAGEAEGRLELLFSDAYRRTLKPVYNYLSDLPDLAGQPTPYLPEKLIKKTLSSDITLDTSRGCPFSCSFCTVINVQGKKVRFRSTDDVEKIIRTYGDSNRKVRKRHFFFTDDNFSRNPNWESILDCLIALREKEHYRVKFTMQIDAQAYKIPRFIDKAARAGCSMVFIGVESINPDNLKSAHKGQNTTSEYREMLKAWRSKGIITMAGYILGFPFDTVESIERDIRTIQRELPIDLLIFFYLTPLPGSQDHKAMLARNEWMESDLNKYDSVHVTMNHPAMSRSEWEAIYHKAWNIYYSPEHVETILRRGLSDGISPSRLLSRLLIGYCAINYEKIHAFQFGGLRRKIRTQRRWGMPLENPFVFYPRRVWEFILTNGHVLRYLLKLDLLVRRIKRETRSKR